eukprot:5742590-Alexandrium_andersonii.AAC.1
MASARPRASCLAAPPTAMSHAAQSEVALQTSLRRAGMSGSTLAGSRAARMAFVTRLALATGPSDG